MKTALQLGRLAFEALAAGDDPLARNASGSLALAIRTYLSDRNCGEPGWALPDLGHSLLAANTVSIELEIDEGLWRELEDEAKHQEVGLEELVDHAVLYYAAQADSGRLTRRIIEDFEQARR
jgi:hypothetical protein